MWPHFCSAWRICSVCLVQRGCSSNILPSSGPGLHGATVPARSLVPAALEHSEPQKTLAGWHGRSGRGCGRGGRGRWENMAQSGASTKQPRRAAACSHSDKCGRADQTASASRSSTPGRANAARRLHSSPRGAAFTHRETLTQLTQRRTSLQHSAPPSLRTLIQGRHKQSGRERN